MGTASRRRPRRWPPLMLGAVAIVLATLPVEAIGTGVAAAAAAPAWTAYVANLDSNTVTPIDTATNTAGTPIAVGNAPDAIAITPNGATAYVVNENDATVTPIDTTTNTAGTPIAVGNDPVAVAITPDGSKAYVANSGDGTVTPINTVTNTAGPAISTGGASTVVVSPDGLTAYVVADQNPNITPINTATDTTGAPILNTSRSIDAAITPDGATLYTTTFTNGSVALLDTATGVRGVVQGFGPGYTLTRGIAISPDGTRAYWTDSTSVVATDTSDPTNPISITPVNATGNVTAIALTPDGSTGYITSSIANTVTPYNTATKALGTPIPVGNSPWAIAITPDQAPLARLQVARAPIGNPTVFDASGSTVAYGTIASYAWDFGDGTTAVTTTPTTIHTYTGGSYTASVTETSSGGTSTASVFTGHTASRNGGQRARATALGSLASLGAPIVSQVTPSTGNVAGGTTVSIIGSGFTGATAVKFGGFAATGATINGDNSITATAPAAASAGPVDVTVTNSLGVSAATPADEFNYLGTAPAVTAPCGGSDPCVVQYGSSALSASATSNQPCNVCNIQGGVEVLGVPNTCPSGQSGQEPAGWIQEQGALPNSPLSALTVQMHYNSFLYDATHGGDPASLQLVNVCWVNGVPNPTGGAMVNAANAKAATASSAAHTLKLCSQTKQKAPCVVSKAIDAGGGVDVTMKLPLAGSTFQIVSPPTRIKKFSPTHALPGANITVTGKNMAGVNAVVVGGVQATIQSRTAKTLVVTVPDGAQTGFVTVSTPSGTVSSTRTLNLDPTITKIPASGKVGAKVKITGVNLTGATGVAFNGTPAAIVSVADNLVVTNVPVGATSGPVTVTTPHGTATSPTAFTLLPT